MSRFTIQYASGPVNYVIQFAKGTGPQGIPGPGGGGGGGGGSANTILHGAGAPSNSLGADGDFYVDTVEYFLYGPKTSGAWSTYVEMLGANGANGLNADMYMASQSLVAIGTGSKIFTFTTPTLNNGWASGTRLRAYNSAGRWMEGVVTARSTTEVTINVDIAVGSGTFAQWFISIAGEPGVPGATGAIGNTGAPGRGITGIAKTGTVGLVDTYTITYSDGGTSTFAVTNGSNGTNGTNGQGVPVGGTTNQVLAKSSNADYATQWVTPSGGGNVSSSGTPTAGQAAEWNSASTIVGVAVTGTGNYVKATSPTLVTPSLGVASATSLNKVAITAPATGATLTIADGATLTASATATVSGTNTGDQTDVTGNAGTATRLLTARAINGVAFDGTSNITIGCALGNVTGLGTGVAAALAINTGTTGGVVTTGSNATFNSIAISGNISAATWGTNGLRIQGVAATLTDTSAAGTVAAAYTNAFGGNTIAATNARTFTTYITAFFREPVAGTNVTIGTRFALGAESARLGSTSFTTIDTTGKLTTPASTTTNAGLSIPHGTAPTSPVNGDVWSTTAGLFARINGSTVGPLGTGGGSGAAPQLSHYPISNAYLTRRGTGASAAALVANRRFYQLVYVAETRTFTELTVTVTVAAASSSIRLGLRNCNQATGQPTTLIVETGLIDSSTTGLKQSTISQSLSPGWYILEITSNGTPTVGAYSAPEASFGTEVSAAGVNPIPTLFRDVAFGSLASDESGNTMARSSTGVIVGIR